MPKICESFKFAEIDRAPRSTKHQFSHVIRYWNPDNETRACKFYNKTRKGLISMLFQMGFTQMHYDSEELFISSDPKFKKK